MGNINHLLSRIDEKDSLKAFPIKIFIGKNKMQVTSAKNRPLKKGRVIVESESNIRSEKNTNTTENKVL